MKKIVPVLLLASLSVGGFAAYHSKTIKVAVRVKTASIVSIAKRTVVRVAFVRSKNQDVNLQVREKRSDIFRLVGDIFI